MLFKNSGKIMYNCLTGNSILYKKQFDFHGGHSFEHAIVQVVDQIRNSFESNQYTFFFLTFHLFKAFDTVNHKILISKLDRIQFIKYNNSNTSFQSIVCGVPQGSILEPLLFLICVNGLKDASKSFVLIMLAEVTNIFYSHKNIKGLFYTANLELEK